MARQFEQYIDTDVTGLVNILDHNLEAYPYIYLLKVDTLNNKSTYMSLFDPLVTEVEALNTNQTKITFTGSFTGYFKAFAGDTQDVPQMIDDIQKDVDFIYDQLDNRVLVNRWTQMNALRDSQLSDLKKNLDTLKTQIEALKNRVDRL